MLSHPATMTGGSTATAASSGSKLSRIMKAPVRALCRVRDFYVSSLKGCAGRANYRYVVGYAGGSSAGVPRSYSFHPSRGSTSSREDDLRDLMRIASQGTVGSLNLSSFQQSPGNKHAGGAGSVVPRSQSAAIGRIDEDKPCDFGMDATVSPSYPRSQTVPLPRRGRGVVA